MDVLQIQSELQKRLAYPYIWGRKQSDDWDSLTNFIYQNSHFDQIIALTSQFSNELKNYALNRWFNFWSAQAVEYFFSTHPKVIKHHNATDKCIDFYIEKMPFDHKTTVFPRKFEKSFDFALQNKSELIYWLYNNQSQEGRKHLKNRIFVVLFDATNGEHWKLKADLTLLKTNIQDYLEVFSVEKLICIDLGQGNVYSDIIFIIK